jgi:hypothetical protein
VSESLAPAFGERRLPKGVLTVLLFVLVGPPVGGIVVILIINAINVVADGDLHGRAMLMLVPFAYVPGFLPALACGLFAVATRSLRRASSLIATTLFGAVAGLGGAYLLSLTIISMLVAPLPLVFYAVFMAAGAVAALVCGLLSEKIGSRRGG